MGHDGKTHNLILPHHASITVSIIHHHHSHTMTAFLFNSSRQNK
jgi:hypothetical protein